MHFDFAAPIGLNIAHAKLTKVLKYFMQQHAYTHTQHTHDRSRLDLTFPIWNLLTASHCRWS